mgnify:CR=1 FL=1
MSFPYPGNFLDVPKELSDTIININIKSVNEMTRIVLPRMVEKYVIRCRYLDCLIFLYRQSGAIINVSSISGAVPAPMLSTYSASKSYVNFFSQCVATEYVINYV